MLEPEESHISKQNEELANIVVTFGFEDPGRKATEEQQLDFKQKQKLDCKARFLIYQCVNSKIFNKISKASTSKEAWEILMKTYGDGEKNKKVKLQTLRRQYELLCMEEKESISDYFDRIQELVNAMRSCNDKIPDELVVDKILRTLPPRFDHVAVAIEESRNLDDMEIEELQHSLEAHEMRINERRSNQEQALQARSNYKGKGKGPWKGNKPCSNQKHQDQGYNAGSEFFKGKKSDQSQKKNDSSNGSMEWKFDKRKVRCHNCQKLGHYARDCWQGEGAKNKPKNQANLAQDEGSDSEAVMLMATTSKESSIDTS